MIIKKLVNNFSVGRQGFEPIGIVIHIGEGSQETIYKTFQKEDKSSHYCVAKSGEIWQFVEEENTAWTQGIVKNPTASLITDKYPGINPNLFLISIEHEGYGHTDITPEQYKATINLVKDICIRWNIPADRNHILKHNEIRADKTCPGMIDVDKIAIEVNELNRQKETREDIKSRIISLLGRL